MRSFERAFLLATSMAASAAAVGCAPAAQAATPQAGQIDWCAPYTTAPPPSGVLLTGTAATGATAGTATMTAWATPNLVAPLTYRFDFGDGSPARPQTAATAQHTYAFAAAYYPTVTVTDAVGTSVGTTCGLEVGTVKDSVHRYAGDDRYLTSSAASQMLWADTTGDTTSRRQAKAVVLASGAGFADALAGVPLAAYRQGPLLLTEPTGLTKTTEDEIKRVLPAGATVYVLGGQAAVSPAVDAQLRTDGYQVTRYAGKDRYGTSIRIATSGLDNPASAIVVTGNDFADALAAGPAATGDRLGAGGKPAAIVLSDGGTVTDSATRSFIEARLGGASPSAGHVLAVGGQAVCALKTIDTAAGAPPCFIPPNLIGAGLVDFGTEKNKTFQGLVGADRFQTAADLAPLDYHVMPTPDGSPGSQESKGLFGLASGTTFADALTGGAALAFQHAPILLTARSFFPPATAAFINDKTGDTFHAEIFGGPGAIAPALQDALTVKIHP